jgi:LmbE family N-acetylglucosaminyl deacetylase
MEDWFVPTEPGDLPVARRVLAFAPHPDDEIYGCGGVLARYVAQGAQVEVVIVTDGAAQVEAGARDGHAATRAGESRAALACLGVQASSFWGLADRSLVGDDGLGARVAAAMRESAAEVVLAPSLWEIHPDHRALGAAVLEAASRADSAAPWLLFYEIGAAQRPNLLVDITDVWPAKLRAMACFASQQQRQDYARHIEALNAWRTYSLPPSVRWAEALTRVAPDDLPRADERRREPAAALLDLARDDVLSRAAASHERLRAQLQAREAALRASIEDFHRAMAQSDAANRELREALGRTERNLGAELSRLGDVLGQREAELREQQASILRLEDAIAQQAARIVAQEASIAAQQADILQHKAALAQRDAEVASLQNLLSTGLAREADLQARLAAVESAASQLRGFLADMERSTSWRVTAPMRWVAQRLRRR